MWIHLEDYNSGRRTKHDKMYSLDGPPEAWYSCKQILSTSGTIYQKGSSRVCQYNTKHEKNLGADGFTLCIVFCSVCGWCLINNSQCGLVWQLQHQYVLQYLDNFKTYNKSTLWEGQKCPKKSLPSQTCCVGKEDKANIFNILKLLFCYLKETDPGAWCQQRNEKIETKIRKSL